ncbi:MAG: ACT domain-containing protein [Thaumarchaeota archaeon]|nr:ACT domain-containing protein [Nitrososphaerota archaeon]
MTEVKTEPQARQYFPRRLALVAPQGELVHEFVVTGRDRIGILSEISTVFAKHFISLTSVDIDTIASGDFVLVTFADFRNSDAPAEQVLKEVTALKSVKSVLSGSASTALFERFMFPITAGGSNRAIILPASALMGYEKGVLEKGLAQGEEHLIATGRPVGKGVSGTLRSYMPWADGPALVLAATEAMRALGWGLCNFDLSMIKEGKVSVTVRNPLSAGLGVQSVSWLLIGVISGLLDDVIPFPNRLQGRPIVSKESDLSFDLELAR